jgi:hypothetical protein
VDEQVGGEGGAALEALPALLALEHLVQAVDGPEPHHYQVFELLAGLESFTLCIRVHIQRFFAMQFKFTLYSMYGHKMLYIFYKM